MLTYWKGYQILGKNDTLQDIISLVEVRTAGRICFIHLLCFFSIASQYSILKGDQISNRLILNQMQKQLMQCLIVTHITTGLTPYLVETLPSNSLNSVTITSKILQIVIWYNFQKEELAIAESYI